VGHAEKNRAWEELGRARAAVARAAGLEGGSAGAAAALEELYAAEASDWFWWYGDDHPSVHRDRFDRLFRSHLTRAYRHLGADIPPSLLASLRDEGQPTEGAERGRSGHYEAAGGAGSMHRASGLLRAVSFDTDGKELHLRIDLEGGPERREGMSVAVSFAGPGERVLGIGLSAADPAVDVRIPLQTNDGPIGETIRFRVSLEREGQQEEVAPHSGWFEIALPA
jgi:hypothetical protein